MAETVSYPQIPTTVWWGVRTLLNKSPKAIISEELLGVELGVQAAAARQYVSELKRVGLLNEDGRGTELAQRWRLDDSYEEAVQQIVARCYGEGLITVAPTPMERAKAVEWFKRQGLGEGAARNKAATYFLISSSTPGESPSRPTGGQRLKPKPASAKVPQTAGKSDSGQQPHDEARQAGAAGAVFPVNLNLQIHISAEATVDQIDAIFSSMRKHLGNARLS